MKKNILPFLKAHIASEHDGDFLTLIPLCCDFIHGAILYVFMDNMIVTCLKCSLPVQGFQVDHVEVSKRLKIEDNARRFLTVELVVKLMTCGCYQTMYSL